MPAYFLKLIFKNHVLYSIITYSKKDNRKNIKSFFENKKTEWIIYGEKTQIFGNNRRNKK